MRALSLDEVRAKVREGSKVLWVYRDAVEEGDVVVKMKDTLALCWLEGYKSRNDDIDITGVLAIWDPKGSPMEVFPWSGTGFMTEAGLRWVEAHPQPAKQKAPLC